MSTRCEILATSMQSAKSIAPREHRRDHDAATKKVGNKVSCPVLGFGAPREGCRIGTLTKAALEALQTWADNVSGGPVAGGHSFRRISPDNRSGLLQGVYGARPLGCRRNAPILACDSPTCREVMHLGIPSGSSERAAHERRRHLIGRAETGRISTFRFRALRYMFNAVVVGRGLRSFVTEAPPW